MAFLDKLRLANIFGNQISTGPQDLFGNLIPRRVEREERPRFIEPEIMPQRQSQTQTQSFPQQRGIDTLSNQRPDFTKDDMRIGDVRWPDADRKIQEKALDLELEKFKYKQGYDARGLGLEERKEFNKTDIDRRKQALDEWQAANPRGEVKVSKDGKIHIINPTDGSTIDTGLMSGDLTEEEKIARQIAGQKEVAVIRGQEARKTAGVREANENPSYVSPTQQRAAEDDAIVELMRDPNYSWLADKGFVTFDSRAGLQIKRPTASGGMFGHSKENVDKTNQRINDFETAVKSKANERMNKTRNKSSTMIEPEVDNNTVSMVAPDGRQLQVPAGEVDAMKALGAKIVGEETVKPKSKSTSISSGLQSDDDIEIVLDSRGKVIEARNKKKQ